MDNKKSAENLFLRFFYSIRNNIIYLIKSTRPFTSVNTALATEGDTSS